jgi:hypothetical protein
MPKKKLNHKTSSNSRIMSIDNNCIYISLVMGLCRKPLTNPYCCAFKISLSSVDEETM